MTAELTDDTLDAGIELRLTYDGQRGSRTVTVYVVGHETDENLLDGEKVDHELTVAEPGARRSRHIRVAMSGTESEDLLAAVVKGERWGTVKSLNSKSDRGRRLGALEAIEPTGSVADRYRHSAAVRAATVGDVLRVDGERGVVTGTDYGTTVEFADGSTVSLRHDATLGACRRTDDYDRERVAVVATGETVTATDAAREAFEAMQGYGHGDEGKVVAVEIAGERHEVAYRHDADERGIRLGDDDTLASEQDTLRLDPLGLTLNGERVATENVTLVREDSDDAEPEADDESAEADGGRVLPDGGETPAFQVGEAVGDVTEPAEKRGTCRVLNPDAGRANAVEVGTTGATVSEFDGNEQFPADDRVVRVVYESALDANVPEWDEWHAEALAAELDAYADEWDVSVQAYDYPESRLTSLADDDADDADDGPRRQVTDLRDAEPHDEPEDLDPRPDGGDEWVPETAALRESETTDTSAHADRNLAAVRQARDELGRGDALDDTRTRAEQIRARRLTFGVVPCGPQADLTGFEVFSAISTEVCESVLLAAGEDLRDLAEYADDPTEVSAI
jgi:hypothetical protein